MDREPNTGKLNLAFEREEKEKRNAELIFAKNGSVA